MFKKLAKIKVIKLM